MGDDFLRGDKAVQDWCHIFAFCFALASVDALVGLGFGRHLGVSAVCFVAACLFYLAGVKGPRIKERLRFRKSAKQNRHAVEAASGAYSTPLGLADLVIEYSHDDRDRSVPPRDRPLLLKNVTTGKNALNVRMKPLEVHDDKLVFRPDIITCIVGGGDIEVVPEWENLKGKARFKLNELPDFLNVFCNRDGRNDKAALDELFQEKSLWLEMHYESDGERLVSECELLFTRWHQQIRMGEHRLRLANRLDDLVPLTRTPRPEKITTKSAAIGHADWLRVAKDFESCYQQVRADYQRSGLPPTDSWMVAGPHSEKCRSLCNLAGAMLLRSPHVASELSEQVRGSADPMHRWLYFLKERKPLDNFISGVEQFPDGRGVGVHAGLINNLPEVSAAACIECAAKEM